MSWIYLYILVVFYSCLVYMSCMLHSTCSSPNSTICLLVSVWESERPPVASSCCLRGSQRLPPWNRRRRGTELGSDRPTKTPLQKLWGEKQEGASTGNTWAILSKYYTDHWSLNKMHPMLLKRCFLLLVDISLQWHCRENIMWYRSIWLNCELWPLGTVVLASRGFLWLQESIIEWIKLTFL